MTSTEIVLSMCIPVLCIHCGQQLNQTEIMRRLGENTTIRQPISVLCCSCRDKKLTKLGKFLEKLGFKLLEAANK